MTRTVDHCPDCGLTAIPVDEPCPGCGFVIPNPFQWDNIRDWIRVCPVKGTDRHVLRAIADRVGHKPGMVNYGNTWVGQEAFVADTGYSKSTIHRALERLEESGLIDVERQHVTTGDNRGNRGKDRITILKAAYAPWLVSKVSE